MDPIGLCSVSLTLLTYLAAGYDFADLSAAVGYDVVLHLLGSVIHDSNLPKHYGIIFEVCVLVVLLFNQCNKFSGLGKYKLTSVRS